MFRSNHFRRRLSIKWHHGEFSATIAPNNDRGTYIFLFVFFTCAFAWFIILFTAACLRSPSSSDALVLLPFLAFIILWYTMAIRTFLWRILGVEELLVENGVVRWTRKAFFWVRKLEVRTREVTDVKAVTPWHGQSNRVEFTALGKRCRVGDTLLHDEAIKLCEKLRQAVEASR